MRLERHSQFQFHVSLKNNYVFASPSNFPVPWVQLSDTDDATATVGGYIAVYGTVCGS